MKKDASSNDKFYQITYKLNGHIKKIRSKSYKQVLNDVINEINHYLDRERSIQIAQYAEKDQREQQHKKTKAILNINIKQLDQQEEGNNKSFQKLQESSLSTIIQNENENISLLKEQIKLFQSPNDIHSFVETQKNISVNIEQELTILLQNSIRICWQLLKKQNIAEVMKFSTDPWSEVNNNLSSSRDLVLIKENLDKIEDSCLQTLNKIKQERRKLEMCAICFINKSNTIFIPCMHIGTCNQCSAMLTNCPFCKIFIEQRKNIYQQ